MSTTTSRRSVADELASDHVLLAKRSSQRESWGANSVETNAMTNTENAANTA
jgi:hypothetical protein